MAASIQDEAGIFNVARQILTPEARQQYLDQTCGTDNALRQRVEALLRIHDQEQTFMEDPVVVLPEAVSKEGPGTQIGNYKLVEVIGEGGFGVVYMAEQRQPIRRTVALKILKPGMDTRQVVARFEAERQALALMDHPNIGKVLDGGESPSGRPYFVMELVKGIPITRYCDEHRLTPDERLKLFIDVCSAVQHAHQKGIIHRDLKPTNVLVAAYDGKPVPKLIDFGVAKAMGQQLTERTMVTGFGSIVGTLEYMSPEQAEFNALDVDTRSDIYSLGVLLYELLTGSTPLGHDRLKATAMAEVLRLIREEDPPKPSMRLSDSRDTLASISAQRKLDPSQLTKAVRGDLDWIVMKSIAKDRNQRYSSAGGLADDVSRYLRDEAIEARQPSVGYQIRKLLRRHRHWLTAAAVALLALVVGTGVAIWEAIAANNAATAASASKKIAESKEAETRAVLEFVQKHVIAAARPEGRQGGLGHDVTLRRALKEAIAAIDESFANQPLVAARVRRTLGDSFLLLGETDTAIELYESASATQLQLLGPEDDETLLTTNNLASSYRNKGRLPDAQKLHEKNLKARIARFGEDHPAVLQSMENLATVYDDRGMYPDGLKLREQVVAARRRTLGMNDPLTLHAMKNLASSYSENNQTKEALKIDQEVLALLEKMYGPDHTETLDSRNNLALDYADAGRFQDALEFQTKTLALYQAKYGKDHPSTLLCMHNVAKAHADLNQYDEAIKLLEKTLFLQKQNPGPDHPNTLQTMYSLGNNFGKKQRYEEALQYHRMAYDLRRVKLGADNRMTLYSMWGVASNLLELKRGEEAIPLVDECLKRAAGNAAKPSFSGLADKRLRYFEARKDAENCRVTAELWEKLGCTDAGSCYNSARFRAVAAGLFRASSLASAADSARDQSERAMVWLQKARTAGFQDVAELKKQKDLDSLRALPAFQKLLADLDSTQGPK